MFDLYTKDRINTGGKTIIDKRGSSEDAKEADASTTRLSVRYSGTIYII